MIGRDLIQQVDVRNRILDIRGKVADGTTASGAFQVVIHPADENLLRRELQKILERLPFEKQRHQIRIVLKVDVGQKTDL